MLVDDASSLFSRLIRYAQTSSTVTNAAARFASEKYLGINLDHTKQASTLKLALGNLKGPIMKVAQFLATVPGALPPEYAKEFLTLQTNAPPMSPSFVKRRMTSELGPDWAGYFATFDMNPTYAASLGQVHQATLHDGRQVACKLQYPDMLSTIDADLNQLKLLLTLYEAWSSSLKTEDIFEEIREKLLEELDYELEAKNTKRYHDIFKNNSYPITVPEVISSHSTKRLLTATWCDGESVMTKLGDPLEKRNHYASLLFYAWYMPFYHHGIIHGDPHPGNYQINAQDGLNLLDFGCVRSFSETFIQGVLDMYTALKNNDTALMVHAYEAWGFQNLTKDVIKIMGAWAEMLFEPLLDDRVRPIQEKIMGWEIASKILDDLAKVGGVKPPREFVFMDRAAVGIGSILFHLQAQLNWHQMFEELIEKKKSIPEKERKQG